ncbi:MAG: 30S ribosome-binding factor RbfA [Chloroflexi bacterium]|nr:30S ribosome-binding factor RbfA [Chloroflexota bacterium]
MPTPARAKKVARRIHEELAVILQREVSDPRLIGISVTGVEVDRELAYATIFITALDMQENMDEILATIRGAAGFLRSQLAARIPLRSFPRLRFEYDASYDRGGRIDELLAQLDDESSDDENHAS